MYPPLLYLTYLKRILQNMPCTTNEILSCQYAFNQVDHLGEFITTDISLSHTFMKLHFQYFFFPRKETYSPGPGVQGRIFMDYKNKTSDPFQLYK